MNKSWQPLLLLVFVFSLPYPCAGQFRYGVLMYYDLCPWQFCGCPFCVAVPSSSTIRPTLTTSTLFPRQEQEPTTTTESFTEETTTETTAADTETITTTDMSTTEMSDTEPPSTEETDEPVTEQPRPSRRTTTRNPTTSKPQSDNNCPTCICNTWSQRVHRWHGQGRNTMGNRFQAWIPTVGFGRSPEYERLSFNRGPTFNRWNHWNQNRWNNNFVGGGGGRRPSNANSQVKALYPPRRPQRSFNQLVFGKLLFG